MKKCYCGNFVIGATAFCKTHGGGKRCQEKGCGSSAQGKTEFCVTHGDD